MAQEDGSEGRRRGNSLMNRISTFRARSRPSSSSSSVRSFTSSISPSACPTPPTSTPSPSKFRYFTLLPFELQAHILTFLPSRVLCTTVGRANRHYKDLVESHVRRRIMTLMSVEEGRSRSAEDNGKARYEHRPGNVLVFEAQRPIDTLTTKHTLHFSHFSQTEAAAEVGSTLAHFSFIPVDHRERHQKQQGVGKERSESADSGMTTSSGNQRTASPHTSLPQPNLGVGALGQASIPIVHADDQERLNQRTVTSSVLASAGSDSRHSSRRLFTDVSSPTEWRETSLNPLRLVTDGGEEQRWPTPPSSPDFSHTSTAARGRGYEGSHSSAPRLTGHWSEPIASSSAAFESDRDSESEEFRRSRRLQKPSYRFQLDPLDSFETWILSLTVQKRSEEARRMGNLTTRPMRWEKRVAEGLDRIFRHWFTSKGPELQGSMVYQADRERGQEEDGEGLHSTGPEMQMLEFDGSSCTMLIQPHSLSPSAPLHPALTSMSSHFYLSNSSLSSPPQPTSRVEFTFHCESLTINAARLLCVLEDVERDIAEARERAKQRGAHVLSGSSGGTTWAYSAGDSEYISSSRTSTSRWNSDQREGGIAVMVFGAVRD